MTRHNSRPSRLWSNIAYVAPTGASRYGIEVGQPSSSVVAAVNPAARHPLPSISEPQARQMVEQFIAQAEKSPNSTIAGNARLADTLAELLLGTTDPAAG